MQMHPLPLLLCSLLFNHENNLPLSLSLFFSPLSIAIEKPRAPLLFSLSKKRMDSRTCSFMEYSQERECFALIKNRMELVSIIDLESRVYFRSTLRYHPNFNNNIQLDVLSRHLLRAISSTIFREICLVVSTIRDTWKMSREVSKFHRKAAIDDHPAGKEDDSRRGVKNSNLNRIWNSWFQGIWKSDSRNISTRR